MSAADERQITASPPLKKRSTRRGLARSVVTESQTTENTPKHVTQVYSTCVERLFSCIDNSGLRVPLNLKNDSNIQSDAGLHQEVGRCLQSPSVLPSSPTVAESLAEAELEKEDSLLHAEPSIIVEDGPPSPPPSSHLSKRHKSLTKGIKTALDTLTSAKGDLLKNTIVSPIVVEESPVKRKDSMIVKVRYMSDVHRFEMASTELFHKLQSQMASLLCTSEDRIGLYLYDTRIGPTETPQSKSLKLADIIECHVLCPGKFDSEADSVPSADTVRILMQCPKSRNNSHLLIKKYQPFRVMMEQYAQQRGKVLDAFKFKFDGDALDPDALPMDMDLEDGDTIDVIELV
ncbi:NFATC2-interacting protein-like [Pomacea canaliculata]|uniref:NFATC2-interacting protein-like n=1 Tax=Pomacea canaliculata TaxID=400727 RepID=UPI000D73FE8D|nr:NFATC2-interacting protein-like [Pomacea canaliculata]